MCVEVKGHLGNLLKRVGENVVSLAEMVRVLHRTL